MPQQQVNWAQPDIEVRSGRNNNVYPVTCLGCGYTRKLRRCDATKAVDNGSCYLCSQKVKAAQGYAAAVDRWGARWVVPHVQAYREAHPSKPEQQMSALLDRLGIQHRREVMLPTKCSGRKRRVYLIDFMLYHDGREHALEVDGIYYHTTNPATIRNDKLKTRFLKRRHIPLLRVTDADLKQDRAEALIVAFLDLAPLPHPSDAVGRIDSAQAEDTAIWDEFYGVMVASG